MKTEGMMGRKTMYVLSVVLVVVLVALGIWYAWRANDQAPSTKGPDTAAAKDVVKTAYTAYQTTAQQGATQSGRTTFIESTTPALATTLKNWDKGYDPILCAQNPPQEITYGEPSIMDGDTMLTLTTKWADSADKQIDIMVDSATNKIASIMCQQS